MSPRSFLEPVQALIKSPAFMLKKAGLLHSATKSISRILSWTAICLGLTLP